MPESCDLVVIGGGCNGTGIARDAAMRGIKTLLVEKNDFSAGTTGASSGMIHGGPRYMLYEVGTTKLACKDAAAIRHIAPHLCFRIPFLVPVCQEDKTRLQSLWSLELFETFFEAYDRFSPMKGGKKHARLSKKEALALEPSLPNDTVGAVTFDEWGIDTARLCVANALAAHECGATLRNHTEVVRILRSGQRVTGVALRHLKTGEETVVEAKLVFNAGGPWAPALAAMAGVEVKLRPSKGIHLLFDRRLTNVAIVSQGIDGRQIFINPHENTTLLGTTDDDYFGDLDDIPVTEDEIEYLLEGIEPLFPEIRKGRIITTWRGVRPTLYGRGLYEDALSREHEIYDHEQRDGVAGFMTMVGGKLASYRIMAEQATDLIGKKLSNTERCRTHLVPLPGGESLPSPSQLSQEHDLHPYLVERLVYRHGARAGPILRQEEFDKKILCPCEPVTHGEARHAIRHEWAETLGDLLRRTRLGMGPCQGCLCTLPATSLLAEEKCWSVERVKNELKDFLEENWRARSPVLRGAQIAQEEMLQMIFQGTLDLGNN